METAREIRLDRCIERSGSSGGMPHAAFDPLMDDSCGRSENFCLSPSPSHASTDGQPGKGSGYGSHTHLPHTSPPAGDMAKGRNRDRFDISGGRRSPAISLGSLGARCNGVGEVLTHRQGLFTQANSLVPNSTLIKHTADRSHPSDEEDPKN